MATYTDGKGRKWEVSIPGFGAVARLRKEGGIDLNSVGGLEQEFVAVLVGNLERTIQGVWFLVREQADKAGVSYDDFLESVTDAQVIRAALLEAVFDFFRPSRAKDLAAILPAMISEAEAVTLTSLRGLAGNSPESAASVPNT